MRKFLRTVLVAVASVALPVASALAVPVSGSISVTPLIVSVSSGTDSVLGANGFTLSTTFTGVGTGDLSGFVLESVAVNNPFTFVPSTAIPSFYVFTNGSATATFDLFSSVVIDRNPTVSGGTIDIFSTGLLRVTGFDDTFATLNFAATKSGPSWSASSTLVGTGRTTQGAPEPATLALLGAGLLGFAFRRKR